MIPFALLSMARSGGHYVRGLLDSHPSVSCQGEWVNRTTDEGFNPKPQAKALGVKLDKWDIDQLPMTLPTLICWGTRFIVLLRENQFEAARSFAQVVDKGGWWRARSGQGHPQPKRVELPVSVFQERWDEHALWVERLKAELPDTAVYLTYEQVVADPSGSLLPVWELLGVDPPLLVESPFLKLESRPLSETVGNYDQLVAAFSGTQYERYL